MVEAKRWPAYSESKFKKLTLSNLNKIRRGSEHHSSKTISLRSIGLKRGCGWEDPGLVGYPGS